jgi:hypothetical protein
MRSRTFSQSRKVSRRNQASPFPNFKEPTTFKNAQYGPVPNRQGNKVEADVYIDGVWDDTKGYSVAGTHAECTKCGHKIESFGVKEGSMKRCLVLLSKECPRGERNFYVEKEKEFQCKACGITSKWTEWKGSDSQICPHCGADAIPF